MLDIEKIKKDFLILENDNLVYLDNSATTQKPKQILEEVKNFYNTSNASPHRGAYKLSVEATKIYDEARKKVADFVNANSSEEIIFTKNATEALNLIAYSYGMNNVQNKDEIVISIMEHHSNLVPWQMVAKEKKAKLNYMYIDENFELPEEEIKNKITNNTKIVSITHVSNVLGTINNIKQISKIAHEKGAIVIVDASQSVPHMKVDVQDMDADFLVFSGHKMLSPLGIGVLYGKKKLLEEMLPFIRGGDMIEYVYEQETTFAELPKKFEAGTQNVAASVGLLKSIEYLNNIGLDNIKQYEQELLKYAKQELEKLDFIELYYTKNEKAHSSVISFNIKGIHPHDVATLLDNYGIAIRAGDHCAQPLIRFLNLPATCRASFYIYNTKSDVDRLVQALKKIYEKFEKYLRS